MKIYAKKFLGYKLNLLDFISYKLAIHLTITRAIFMAFIL